MIFDDHVPHRVKMISVLDFSPVQTHVALPAQTREVVEAQCYTRIMYVVRSQLYLVMNFFCRHVAVRSLTQTVVSDQCQLPCLLPCC